MSKRHLLDWAEHQKVASAMLHMQEVLTFQANYSNLNHSKRRIASKIKIRSTIFTQCAHDQFKHLIT